MTPIDSVPGFHPGEPQEGPVPMRGVSSQAGLAAVQYGVVAPVTFEAGDRVEYVDGPQKYLRGVHGTVRRIADAVEPIDGGVGIPARIGVQFDGHGATWYVVAKHLRHLSEEVAS